MEVALLNYGAIPHVLSTAIVQRLPVIIKEIKRSVTVATGDRSPVGWMLTDLLVTFAKYTVLLKFLVTDGSPLKITIGETTMEGKSRVLDLWRQEARFTM